MENTSEATGASLPLVFLWKDFKGHHQIYGGRGNRKKEGMRGRIRNYQQVANNKKEPPSSPDN